MMAAGSRGPDEPDAVLYPASNHGFQQRRTSVQIKFNYFWMVLAVLMAPLPVLAQIPSYQNFTPPSGIAGSAGEPSIGADWKTGKILFQALLETDRIPINPANPSTAIWEQATPTTSVASLDPILFTDSVTGRTFVSELAGVCSLSSFTDNDGASYTPSVGCGVPAGIDHQTIGGGLHGHIKVGPDGTAYVPNKNCGTGNAAVVSSRDNGLTWTIHIVPGSTSGASDPSVAVASDNTVYLGWHGGNGHPMV